MEKRLVIINSEEPSDFKSDNIYLTLKKQKGRPMPYIEVQSNQQFGYKNYAIHTCPRIEVTNISNEVSDGAGYYRLPIESVLCALVEENNIQIDNRLAPGYYEFGSPSQQNL